MTHATALVATSILALGCPGTKDAAVEHAPTVTDQPSTAASADTDAAILESVVAIEAGINATCALLADGRIACWGVLAAAKDCAGLPWVCDPSVRPVLLPGDTEFTQISGGGSWWWGVDRDGALYHFGRNIPSFDQSAGTLDGATADGVALDPAFAGRPAPRESKWVQEADAGMHSLLPLRFGVSGVKERSSTCYHTFPIANSSCPSTVPWQSV